MSQLGPGKWRSIQKERADSAHCFFDHTPFLARAVGANPPPAVRFMAPIISGFLLDMQNGLTFPFDKRNTKPREHDYH